MIHHITEKQSALTITLHMSGEDAQIITAALRANGDFQLWHQFDDILRDLQVRVDEQC